MKPTLIVEGKVRKVSTIHFFEETQPTALVEMESDFKIEEITSDAVGNLIWEGRYKPIVDELNAHLEESKQHQQELKNKIAAEVIVNSSFEDLTPNEGADFLKTLRRLAKEYISHEDYIDGVEASIEYVKAQACKEKGFDADE